MRRVGGIFFFFRACAASLAFAYIVFFPFCGKAEQTGSSEVIRKFDAALLEAMKRSKELGYQGRYKLLEPVIKKSFALPYMAGIVLGSSWNTLNEQQRRVFIDTYTEWTIATYAGRFNDYSGEKFEQVSESKPSRGTVTVVTRLVQPKGEDVDFHYLLRPLEGGWRIVDIKISGVSQLALTRAQFTSVMRVKGFDGLISMLRSKIKGYAKGGEK